MPFNWSLITDNHLPLNELVCPFQFSFPFQTNRIEELYHKLLPIQPFSSLSSLKLGVTPFVVGEFIARSDRWTCDKSHYYERIHLQFKGGQTIRAPALTGGYLRIGNNEIKTIPIPDVTSEQQAPIIVLVDQILAAKAADPHADTAALEKGIDKRVYALYNLTEKEITIVEASEWINR